MSSLYHQSYLLLQQAVDAVHGRRILLCPLNWGLGHATRCVPIVKALLKAGKEVVIAADGLPLAFFQQEFGNLPTVRFAGIEGRYSRRQSQAGAMLRQLPYFLFAVIREHRQLKRLVEAHHIDTVISDNRFGCWLKSCESIYITHQLMVKMPGRWLETIVHRLHHAIIIQYNACWIPDMPSVEDSLSGDLSHRYPLPANGRFIGILSRFEPTEVVVPAVCRAVAILSGPEPQRTLLEEKLIARWENKHTPLLIVSGKLLDDSRCQQSCGRNITLVSHLTTAELAALLASDAEIYCRSGYSTLMDLACLGRTATLIPTPGQTEQIYLAELAEKRGFRVIRQEDL
ncbi:MAG: hypothetical protein LBS16_03690 [Prevotellaceae bacterium]|jgi:predicted glycosyltransferase|nr:hypothetical protein [Prevotellaceae bacterium]